MCNLKFIRYLATCSHEAVVVIVFTFCTGLCNQCCTYVPQEQRLYLQSFLVWPTQVNNSKPKWNHLNGVVCLDFDDYLSSLHYRQNSLQHSPIASQTYLLSVQCILKSGFFADLWSDIILQWVKSGNLPFSSHLTK